MDAMIQRSRLATRERWARARVAWTRIRRSGAPAEAFARLRAEAGRAHDGGTRVNCIVFSKDRALQLEACLRSIERHAPYDGPVQVIYKASSASYAETYQSLAGRARVRFVAQSDSFRGD